jgi:hypothetical protein
LMVIKAVTVTQKRMAIGLKFACWKKTVFSIYTKVDSVCQEIGFLEHNEPDYLSRSLLWVSPTVCHCRPLDLKTWRKCLCHVGAL